MSQQWSAHKSLSVQRLAGLGGFGVWMVCRGEPGTSRLPAVEEWRAAAERTMERHAEVATVSIVSSGRVGPVFLAVGDSAQASTAVLPLAFFSGRTAELLGLSDADDQTDCSTAQFEKWVAAATLKGLVHRWLAADSSSLRAAALVPPDARARAADEVVFPRTDLAAGAGALPTGIVVGIDAAWLSGSESGAQVAAVEMIRELATRNEIGRIVLVSDSGVVPRFFDGVPKVSGLPWQEALVKDTPVVDVLHRPYQPDLDMDYGRYHRVAHCVALTVLDLIAYDNPAYHESEWSWRRYQETFGENVCLADCVFAISRHIADRLEYQFAHQLPGPVRPIPLGTDHLAGYGGEAGVVEPELNELEGAPFLLVLGSDFEHKNRDFAVRVFADLRDRGYEGRLVLAGYHLDGGSTFDHELSGAGSHATAIVRMGSVSSAAKRWLLRHAEVVLYPTSSEGFGLVPFEAAALDTPTAFVAFGPLQEMLPGVDSCAGWQVRGFADHVVRLRSNPGAQVAQIRAAGATLTWGTHVDRVLDGYRGLMREGAPWRTRSRVVPGATTRFRRAIASYEYRAHNKLRRLTGRK